MTFPLSDWVHRAVNGIFNLERRGAESDLRRLRREVIDQYGFLFSEHGGRILPQLSQAVTNLDWATVVVQVNRIYLRASRDREKTDWHVSLNDQMGPWYRLDQILKKIQPSNNLSHASDHDALRYHLPEIEQILRSGR
jgi:hypothetical protein